MYNYEKEVVKGEEYNIQANCVKWFRLQYPDFLIWNTPNEATYRNKGYFGNLGVLTGVSDLIVALPNHIMFIEMKSKTGRQSLEQKQFQQKVESLGFEYYLIRSFDDFHNLIESKLK